MLRFLIGLTLLLLAVTLPLRAPVRGEPIFDEGRSLLEQLLQPREPTAEQTERFRLDEEKRQREEQNALATERMLVEKRASLANVGPTFEISSFSGGLTGSRLLAACLIGETGKVYTYDPKKDPAAQTTGLVDEGEFSKAASLAKSVEHSEWRPQRIFYDFGVVAWTVSLDGRTTPLQVAGDYLGALPDPRVGELVALIDGWCPNAQEIRSRLELPAFEGRLRPPH